MEVRRRHKSGNNEGDERAPLLGSQQKYYGEQRDTEEEKEHYHREVSTRTTAVQAYPTIGISCVTKLIEMLNTLIKYFATIIPGFAPGFSLTEVEKAKLEEFKVTTSVAFKEDEEDHTLLLQRLWFLSFKSNKDFQVISEMWSQIGFQNKNPSTDFRGAGVFGLLNLIYFGERYPVVFSKLVSTRANDTTFDIAKYPFAIAGLNVTMMLFEILGWGFKAKLNKDADTYPPYRTSFLKLLLSSNIAVATPNLTRKQKDLLSFEDEAESENQSLPLFEDVSVYGEVYCLAFMVLDEEWHKINATYLEFPTVLQNTRNRMERILPTLYSVHDIVKYNQSHPVNS